MPPVRLKRGVSERVLEERVALVMRLKDEQHLTDTVIAAQINMSVSWVWKTYRRVERERDVAAGEASLI